MGLKEEIQAEFAHLGASVDVTEADVARVQKDLAAADPGRVEGLMAALGYETSRKRQAAVAIAVAEKVANLFATMVVGV